LKTSVWSVIALAIVLGFVAIITGKWTSHYALSLGALVILGALFPPLALALGLVALLWMLMRNPGVFSGNLSGALSSVSAVLKPKGTP
jgi:hypothetical protein